MMKKIISMMLVLVMIVGCLSISAFASGDVTKVTYYSQAGQYASVVQEAINEWNEGEGKDKGIFIEYNLDVDTGADNIRMMAQAGQFVDIVDYPDVLQDMCANGYFLDLSKIDGLKDLVAEYADYTDSRYYYNGALIGLPLEVIPCKMAVNLDLFEKNNLELPKTWADVVECARIITENGDGVDFGYGWTTAWVGGCQRMLLQANMADTGKGWWDPNTGTYDFSQFKDIVALYAEMYQNGYMFPDPIELSIDGVRAQFAEGHIGMIVAYGYDIGVYNNQFPATCNWTIIDCPTMTGDPQYKYVYEPRSSYGITIGAKDHLDAVVEVYKFLSSDELYQRIYKETGAMIPINSSIIEGVTPNEGIKNIAEMADMTNYASTPCFPDLLLTLPGGDPFYNVIFDVVYGNTEWDDVIDDLNARYNEAYQNLKNSGNFDVSLYEYAYDISR